ncbi:MFS transporter [Paenibacillus apiarius]|uniref:MFS transporter n=1 Tax=Paenibacillus apiarius TaxID=46240 RepID=A0ABT4E1J8_9BACL|nr:MFS transporter [Paenibacillus apiarius]MCY9517748.1 MFS transporter [Paenibacillus apiarius]MCY9523466.1 MFS transporter [Paenibacillus apiarius]MCY9554963.1 MFS transporter [Paenibacillus apiarius]MCY9561542.1 MFS transporter [Paenibacillus apiarius]MCY9682216.1 MFS transporter [Paenibacillus apiarius]
MFRLDFRVYILALAAFVVGTVELIIGGILDQIASDLHISVSAAGQLITIFSIAFAVSAPILMNVTARFERKKLYLVFLFVFLISNLIVAFSSNYVTLLAARALSASSGSLLVVLSITIASKLVRPEYKGRAIGVIYMGISGSLVLGVPIGMLIGNAYGWRAPFLFVALLTAAAMGGIYAFLSKVPPSAVTSLRMQMTSLKNAKLVSGHLISYLMLTGHLTMYAYFTPYLQTTFQLSPGATSVVYFLFGLAAVSGGGLGGWLADKWGTSRSMLVIVSCFALAMFILPLAAQVSFYVFMAAVMLWSALSWALSPAQQSYLMQTAPETSDIQLSLNSSVLHLGIASGSVVGGIVIEQSSVAHNAWVGCIFVLLALGSAVYSLTRPALGKPAAPAAIAE